MPEQQPQPTAPFTPAPAAQDASSVRPTLVPATPQSLPFPPNPPSPPLGPAPPQRLPRWLQQAVRFAWVIFRIYIGLALCLAPWLPPFWDANPLFTQFPSLAAFITHGAVRGFISGLGLLNLWVALQDMIRLPDHPRPR